MPAKSKESAIRQEKLAHLQYEKWLAQRQEPTRQRIAQALEVVNRLKGIDPGPEDRLPDGYVLSGTSSVLAK